jgi:4-amino-4-deoxy-L-arabinose transferase-like glycosyltransferase
MPAPPPPFRASLAPADGSSWMPSARALWALLIAVALVWFATLDARHLVHPDEGRYAEIAREMAASGDWVTPRLNELKYFEKPPLQYWLTAAAYRVFGVHEWTAHLWPALAGFLGVLAIATAGYALGGRLLGAFAGLALATMVLHAGIAQIVTLDSGLSFFLALGFAALVIAQRAETGDSARRTWMWVAAAALAGATLSKGLIGLVLPGGALVVYTAATRDFALWRRLSLGSGLVVYLLVTAPWFIAVALANDDFLRFFFIHEHVQRFLTTEHSRPGAWYYFVPWLLAGLLPWLSILGAGLVRAWRDGAPNALGFSWQRFALVWAAFVFVFFSASGSKLPSYILPMFPPLALVTGWLLARMGTRTLIRLLTPLALSGIVLALALVFAYDRIAPRFATDRLPASVLLDYGVYLKVAASLAALGGIVELIVFRAGNGSPRARFIGLSMQSLTALAGLQIAIAGFDTLSPMRSSSAILRTAQQVSPIAADAPFYQVEMYDQTVPFYLGRATRLAAYRGELALGIDAEPGKQVPTREAWIAEWQSLPRGYAMMEPELNALLAAQGVPMRELARDPRRVVVSRQ